MAASSVQPRALLNRVVYNGGRILTYAILGTMTGTLGLAFNLAGWKEIISISLGAGLIVLALTGVTHVSVPFITPMMTRLQGNIKKAFAHFLSKKNRLAMLAMGMINGLLPCGLTYIALAYTVTLDPMSSFLFMVCFGAGTLPAMLGATSFLHQGIARLRLDARRVTLSVMIVAGVLLVSRSLVHDHHDHHEHAETEITVCEK